MSRLLTLLCFIGIAGGLAIYLSTGEKEDIPSSTQTTTSLFNESDSDEKKFVDSVTIPANFTSLTLPVRIEHLDKMIDHCNHLMTKETDFRDRIQTKVIALRSLKCTSMAEGGLEVRPIVDDLIAEIQKSGSSENPISDNAYLLAYVKLTILSFDPESSFYNDVMKLIEEIDTTTPAPPSKILGCHTTALRYFNNAKDKQKAGALLIALGKKISASKEDRLADYGLALMDYPHYRSLFEKDRQSYAPEEEFVKDTFEMFDQLDKTPPQSAQTYDKLLVVPELFLQSGNMEVAKKFLAQIRSVASNANSRIQSYVQTKIEKSLVRVSLLGNQFPVAGHDIDGKAISFGGKEKSLVLFWSPDKQSAKETLNRIKDSSLNDRWSTDIFLVAVTELTDQELATLKKTYPLFRVLDSATSKAWMENSGVNTIPYLLTLDRDAVVRRMENL